MKQYRNTMAALIICAGTSLSLVANAALPTPACQPGYWPARSKYPAEYNELYQQLRPYLEPSLGGGNSALANRLSRVQGQAAYENLLDLANDISANDQYRVVITLPDGTVVLDTSRDDWYRGDSGFCKSDPRKNCYVNFQNKTINENHNSRVAIFSAQALSCGYAIETKSSTTTGQKEHYLAVRLNGPSGSHLDSAGTVRISLAQ